MSALPARLLLPCALALAGACMPVAAQTAAEWRAAQVAAADKSEQIMREANRRKGLLAQYQVMMDAASGDDMQDRAFAVIFSQYLSWYQSYIGDYPHAESSFSVQEGLLEGDSASPLSGGYKARPALEAIPELAKHYQAVFFNEAHNIPLTRTLTVQLLGRLRQEGFDYFAVETLYQTDTQLQSRGYPVEDSGFYTNEPIYGEMVRTALKLGFKVIAYEAESGGSGDARESAQARNIYEQVFKKDPQARLVVNAGYAHIQETGSYLGGSSMAEHLFKLTGIDPLTVEQTMLVPHPAADHDHPYYTAVMQQLHPDAPIVFEQPAGKPWALRAGYDVSVFFPPVQIRRGRPTWLTLGGLRKPYFVSGDRPCKNDWPCLVEARYADEGPDAIPADRMLFDPPPQPAPSHDRIRPAGGATSGELYLRPGRYTLTITDQDGHVLEKQRIRVTGSAARSTPDD
jgi:hypothetical protein